MAVTGEAAEDFQRLQFLATQSAEHCSFARKEIGRATSGRVRPSVSKAPWEDCRETDHERPNPANQSAPPRAEQRRSGSPGTGAGHPRIEIGRDEGVLVGSRATYSSPANFRLRERRRHSTGGPLLHGSQARRYTSKLPDGTTRRCRERSTSACGRLWPYATIGGQATNQAMALTLEGLMLFVQHGQAPAQSEIREKES
jgi:hypothetical protein